MEPWILKKRSRCYNCDQLVDHIIEIYPNQVFIRCSNCKVTRCYVIKTLYIDRMNTLEEEMDKKYLYDNWLLEGEYRCSNCKEYTTHDILITVAGVYVRCRNCKFTRYYRFYVIFKEE
ncbi:MAG TPA: hypothetical protein EYH15_04040 [Methanothermococcus okinawensis]|uniref:Uncharacterized protein n=1 Tax=Methanothermococcus okinawensis TaxID=155863 RepID=A0A832ZCV9_9EURY|nr:hypothetical protein [Methanococcaceae archaeon]HIP84639.1 hypothetical protein [Methanothermococcus okinawensis]HIP91384.1 hypothetical protein [Methanothermococcus okinawensis]